METDANSAHIYSINEDPVQQMAGQLNLIINGDPIPTPQPSGPVMDMGPTNPVDVYSFPCGNDVIFIAHHETFQPEETLPQSISELSYSPLFHENSNQALIPFGIHNFREYYDNGILTNPSQITDRDVFLTLNQALFTNEANQAYINDTLRIVHGIICSSEYVFTDENEMLHELVYVYDGPSGEPVTEFIYFPTDSATRSAVLDPYSDALGQGSQEQRPHESMAVFFYDEEKERNVGFFFVTRPFMLQKQERSRKTFNTTPGAILEELGK